MKYNVNVGFVRYSSNRKLGPIPVVTSESKTCPSACPLKKNGCYAEYGPMGMKWRAVDGTRTAKINVKNWDEMCELVKKLPKKQMWRLNDAGDLPGDDNEIDLSLLDKVVKANKGKRSIAYSHKPTGLPGQKIFEQNKERVGFSYEQALINARAIRAANLNGFTINLSADSLEEADELYDLNIAPVVTVLPTGAPNHSKTPKGRHVIVCPAQYNEDMTCERCGICAMNRKAIVGFIVHGPGKNKINAAMGVVKVKGKKHLQVVQA